MLPRVFSSGSHAVSNHPLCSSPQIDTRTPVAVERVVVGYVADGEAHYAVQVAPFLRRVEAQGLGDVEVAELVQGWLEGAAQARVGERED